MSYDTVTCACSTFTIARPLKSVACCPRDFCVTTQANCSLHELMQFGVLAACSCLRAVSLTNYNMCAMFYTTFHHKKRTPQPVLMHCLDYTTHLTELESDNDVCRSTTQYRQQDPAYADKT